MEDHFDIRTLPSIFISESHPSEIIEKLNEKQKLNHNAFIEEMHRNIKEANTETEEEILKETKNIKSKIQKLKEDTDYFVFLVLHTKEDEYASMEKKYIQNISNKIFDSTEMGRVCVDELYQSLVAIEKQRSEKLKQIINQTYEKLLDISYKPPYELEEILENEIHKMNQLMINNYQLYAELKAKLKLQIENDMRIWMQKLLEIKNKFKQYLRDLAIKQSEGGEEHLEHDTRTLMASMMNRRFSEYDAMKMVLEFRLSQFNIRVGLKDVNSWLQDVQMTMACLDKSAKYIVTIYKAAIVVIFHRFFKELEDIKTTLLDLDLLNREYIEPHECEIYTPTVEELNLQSENDLSTLQQVWGDLINSIEESLNESYLFVKKATYLWDRHFIRTQDAQKLVLEDVTNVTEKNIISEEITESKVNIILDKLRQSPSEQDLNTCLDEVTKSLENIEEMYRIHNIEEQKVVEKYKDFINTEIDVLMAEIKRFLTVHPPDEERDPKKQRKRASQESQINIDPTEELIPTQMLFCRYEVEAVSNWMFGLWEAINHYTTSGRAEIMAIAEEWINVQCEKIKERLKFKLAFCRSRYLRIKYSIYEKRLEELTRHSSRLERHQKAVDMEIKILASAHKSNEETYRQILKTTSAGIEKNIKQVGSLTRTSQVQKYKENLKIINREAGDSMANVLGDLYKSCDKLMENVKISNLKYKRAIRFFAEYGNYNIEEAKVTLKDLNKLYTTTTKQLETIKKVNKSLHTNYKQKLEVLHTEASLSVKEIIEEHGHNEKTVQEIMKLHNEIRDMVISYKTRAANMKKTFKNLTEVSVMKLSQPSYLESFSKKFQKIVYLINTNGRFLIHPDPVILYSTVHNKWNTTVRTDHKDDIKQIFHFKPDEDDICVLSFLSKLNNALYHSFNKIHSEAKEFYMKRKILLPMPRIQPTYESFIEEVLQRYRRLLVQNEICWLQLVFDFINFTNEFTNFKKEFLHAFENAFHKYANKYFKKVHTDILKKLYDEKENLEDTFRKMHSKLKTLHGHPNNKHLLDQLQLEFTKLVKNTKNDLADILKPHMTILTTEFENLKNNYKKGKEELKCVIEASGVENLQITLNKQHDIKLNLMKKINEEYEEESVKSETGKDENIPLSVSKEILDYMKKVEDTATTKTDLITNLTVTSGICEEPSRDFLNELQEYFDKYKKDITDFVNNKLIKYYKQFQLSWSNDVENILNLYKVKYDRKNT